MTTAEFNMMPLLLKRRDVLAITGWTRHTLEAFVASGELKPAAASKKRGDRFFKREELRRLVL